MEFVVNVHNSDDHKQKNSRYQKRINASWIYLNIGKNSLLSFAKFQKEIKTIKIMVQALNVLLRGILKCYFMNLNINLYYSTACG